MSITNHVQLIGYLGGNPKILKSDQSTKILSVSLATHEHYKDHSGHKQTKTEWHNLIGFNGLADILEKYTQKGSLVLVIGKLQTRQYIDKNNVSRYVTEILLEKVQLLSGKESQSSQEN